MKSKHKPGTWYSLGHALRYKPLRARKKIQIGIWAYRGYTITDLSIRGGGDYAEKTSKQRYLIEDASKFIKWWVPTMSKALESIDKQEKDFRKIIENE